MKKGQITTFIIVGIVILLVVGLGIAAYKIVTNQKPPEAVLGDAPDLALKPLQTYVEACLRTTAEQVLIETGLHGGYYAPENYGFTAIPERPTESRALDAFDGMILPYWNYLASPNTCTDCFVSSEQPPLTGERYPAVEYQVEQAIEQNLPQCLRRFEQFPEFVITPKSTPRVSVDFGQSNTKVALLYELSVKTQSESVSTIRSFTVDVDVPFRKAYEYAENVVRVAQNPSQPFFAGLTLEVITIEAIGTADEEPIPPPFGGTSLTTNPGPFWIVPKTRDILARALEANINNVQVLGSRDMDFVYTDDPLTNNYYANYYMTVPNADSSVATNFVYTTDWEPYVAVFPCRGNARSCQVVWPDFMTVGIPFLPGLKKKDFQYDVSYPVLTQLRVTRPSGEDFLFQFPFEVNLRANNPLALETADVQEPDYNFCDPSLAGGTVTNITVVDQAGLPVSADVRYSCIANSCALGTALGGQLTELQLPVCIGGLLEAEREGYRLGTLNFDSTPGRAAEAQIVLQKRTAVDVEVKGVNVIRQAEYSDGVFGAIGYRWVLADSAFAVAAPQRIMLVLTPRGDADNTQILTYPDETEGAHRVSLYPGVYDITAVALETPFEPKIVRGGDVCYDSEPLNPFGGEECQTIPDITLGATTYTDEEGVEHETGVSEIYVGGFDWNEETKNVTITQEMLDTGTLHVTVPIIYLPDVQMIDDSRNDLTVFDKLPELANELEIS